MKFVPVTRLSRKMKVDSVAVAIAIATIVLMSGSVQSQDGAPVVSCLLLPGAWSPWSDATTLVQTLRLTGGQCCQTNNDVGNPCSVLLTSGDSAATLCAPVNYCMSCAAMGEGLNGVLAQCNTDNQVQGDYSPDPTNPLITVCLTSIAGAP